MNEIDVGEILLNSLYSSLYSVPLWVWLFITTPVLLRLVFLLIKRQKLSESGIKEIDTMNGNDFELRLMSLFEKKGYKVTHVGTSYEDHRGDFGCDLVIEKNGLRTAVQSKRNINKSGIFGIREAIGAREYYQCNSALVVSNNFFTSDAIAQAKASRVELWDRNRLIAELQSDR